MLGNLEFVLPTGFTVITHNNVSEDFPGLVFILYFSTGHHCALICSVHVNTRTCTVLYEFCVFPGLVFMLYFSTGRLCALICSVNVNTRTCTVLSEQRLMETTVIPGIYANTELCGLASGGRSADQWEPEVEEKFLIQC